MQGICSKCPHRSDCKVPCEPVRKFLAENGPDLWEKDIKGKNGETITIFYGSKIVRNETFLLGTDSESITFEGKNPFRQFEPKLVKTGIFVDRLFRGWSYSDLSVKYGLSSESVRKIYHSAKMRLFEVLEALDSGKPRKFEHIKKKIEARSGHYPRGQKWYLLSKLFGLSPSEIATYEGLESSKPVYERIKVIGDQIAAGELTLFEFDEEKIKAAKARLEAKRARDRKSYHLRKTG